MEKEVRNKLYLVMYGSKAYYAFTSEKEAKRVARVSYEKQPWYRKLQMVAAHTVYYVQPVDFIA